VALLTILGEAFIAIKPDSKGFEGETEKSVLGSIGGIAKKGAIAMGVAVGAMVTKGLTAFIPFERQMNEVFTLLPGISGKAMDEMTGQVKGFAKDFGVLPDQVVPALYQALSAGVPQENVFSFLETAQKAAKGGVTDLTTAVDGISSVVNSYGADVIDATKASDLMFTAVRLGKCIRGDQRVILADGTYKRIDELQGGARIVAWDGRGLTPADAKWIYQGKKPTVTMRTQLGREIVTTWNHPYLVQRCRHGSDCQRHTCQREEWVKVKDLAKGDRVAVPTHVPVMGTEHVEEHEAGLLGLWLADGTSQLGSPQITTMDYADQLDVWASKWGCTVNAGQPTSKATTYRIVAGKRGGRHKNPITEWLRSLGLGNCSASTKHLPDEAFRWDRESTATLLRWLFNGDGWLSNMQPQRSGYQLGFCSMSERLVRDISHLLLRFGIVGRIRRKGEAWVWETNRWHSVAAFVQHIGIDRPDAMEVLIHEPVKQRRRIGQIEFDPIVSIEEGEAADVYDLIVPGPHNFIAEDVLAHNTNFQELSASLFQVNPIASSLGVQFGDVTAALAAMTAQGVPTSVATTQLRQAFVEMSKEGTKTSTMFQQLAGKTFKEFIAAGGNTQEALQLLEGEANRTGIGINDLFGSVEAGSAALALTGGGTGAFSDALNAMGESAGATDAAFNQMNQGLGPLVDKLKAFGAVLLLDIGEGASKAIYWLGDKLAPTFEALRGHVDKIAPVVRDVLVSAFERLSTVIGIIAPIVSGVLAVGFTAMGVAIDVAVFAISTLVGWFENPIFQVLAGIIAVSMIPALIGLGIHAAGAGAQVVFWFVAMKLQAISSAATTVAHLAVMGAKFVWAGLVSLASAANVALAWIIALGPIALVVAAVVAATILIVKHWDWIKETVGNVVEAVGQFLGRLIGWVANFAREWGILFLGPIGVVWKFRDEIGGAVGAVVGFFGRLVSGAADKLGELVAWVRGVPDRIVAALGNLGRILYDAGLAVMRGLRDGIVDGFKAVAGFVGGIAGKIARLKGPLDYDKRLLIPAGVAIMEGLDKGLAAREKALRQRLAAITAMIAAVGPQGDVTASTGGAGGGGGGGGVPAALLAELRNLTAALAMLAASQGASGNWTLTGTDPRSVGAAVERQLNWGAGG
jgi:hypothetical protein